MDSTTIEQLNSRIRELEAENAEQANAITRFEIAEQEIKRTRVFTCFSRLPAELQDRVWQLTLRRRIIEISAHYDQDPDDFLNSDNDSDSGSANPGPKNKIAFQFRSNEKPQPVISRVCKGSRATFLRQHFLLYNVPEDCKFPPLFEFQYRRKNAPLIYINPKIDTVYLYRFDSGSQSIRGFSDFYNERIKYCTPGTTRESGIKSFALDYCVLGILRRKPSQFYFFDQFPLLEELVFVWDPAITTGDYTIDATTNHAFINPAPEKLHQWEAVMKEIGHLQQSRISEKFRNLEITAALRINEPPESQISDDNRNGFVLVGPPNKKRSWTQEDEKKEQGNS